MVLKKHFQHGKDSLKFTTPRGHIVQQVGGNSSPQQGHGISPFLAFSPFYPFLSLLYLIFYNPHFHFTSCPPILCSVSPNPRGGNALKSLLFMLLRVSLQGSALLFPLLHLLSFSLLSQYLRVCVEPWGQTPYGKYKTSQSIRGGCRPWSIWHICWLTL